jgi:hypothetical protein
MKPIFFKKSEEISCVSINNFLPKELIKDLNISFSEIVYDETTLSQENSIEGTSNKIWNENSSSGSTFSSSRDLKEMMEYNEPTIESSQQSFKEYLLIKFIKKEKNLSHYLRTQKGSRQMQKKVLFFQSVKNGFEEGLDFLLTLLIEQLPQIMNDQYRNYFCKEVFYFCNPKQRIFILNNVNFFNLFFLKFRSKMTFYKFLATISDCMHFLVLLRIFRAWKKKIFY